MFSLAIRLNHWQRIHSTDPSSSSYRLDGHLPVSMDSPLSCSLHLPLVPQCHLQGWILQIYVVPKGRALGSSGTLCHFSTVFTWGHLELSSSIQVLPILLHVIHLCRHCYEFLLVFSATSSFWSSVGACHSPELYLFSVSSVLSQWFGRLCCTCLFFWTI